MLINIQEKINQGKSNNYVNWAKNFNLKQIAKVLMFLQEQGIDNIDDLANKTSDATKKFNELSASIKDAEKRLTEIIVLKTHIINYSKTRSVYVNYRKAGYSKKFYEEHREEITIHKAAKEAFD